MARILYGVNGEGSGHSTRSKEVISHLLQRGHEVHAVSFDRGLQNLSRDFEVTEIYGLRFAYVNNQVKYGKTVTKNLFTVPQARKSVTRLVQLVDEWCIDLVITDFEPLSCYVGHRKHLPVISIDNQHLLTNASVTYPKEYRKDATACKLVTRCMTPRANAYIVISIFEAPITKKNTFVFAPILRREVLEARPASGEEVLVYVTSPSADLATLLRGVRAKFVCYGFGREGQDGNLTFKKPSMDGFLGDLVGCKAVIANAGFSLVSEALHLGKPYLAIPVKHQFEQILNAYYVDTMRYGAFWPELNKERVESFLFNRQQYEAALASYPREGNGALLGKLDDLIAAHSPRARSAAAH
jgi:uncharacterized protein (TIGR00661 family)